MDRLNSGSIQAERARRESQCRTSRRGRLASRRSAPGVRALNMEKESS